MQVLSRLRSNAYDVEEEHAEIESWQWYYLGAMGSHES